MDLNPVLPKLHKCPTCGAKALDILYGLQDGNPKKDTIDAGCALTPDSPTKGCEKCGWRGAFGGRTWETKFVETWEDEDETDPHQTIVSTHTFDLLEMSDEELLDYGSRSLEARYELVHRGFEPEKVDEAFSDAVPMPLIRKDDFTFFWNTKTGYIEQVSYFWAHWCDHTFMFIRPGMSEWGGASNLEEFHREAFKFKAPDVEVWSTGWPDEFSDDDAMSDPANFGSDFIKSLLSHEALERSDFEKSAERIDPAKYWPDWFEPGFSF